MKKISALLSFLILFTAFTCENEPLEGDFVIDDPDVNLSCADATQNTVTATTNFAGVAPDNENYTQFCLAYTNALEDQIEACGDDGTIQAIIDSLGNCGQDNQPAECEAASIVAAQAETAYNNDNSNEDLCNAYKTALQNKITACGDDGSIQTIINDLGDCTQPSVVEISLTAGTLPIEFDLVNVVEEGDLLKVTGNSSANGAGNYEVYFEVNFGDTGIDIINSTFYLTLTSTFYPDTSGFDDFTSNITVNSTGSLIGVFGGIVINADNGQLSLTSGNINISY